MCQAADCRLRSYQCIGKLISVVADPYIIFYALTLKAELFVEHINAEQLDRGKEMHLFLGTTSTLACRLKAHIMSS